MKLTPTQLPEVLLVEPRLFRDARGHFLETYHRERYGENGLLENFVQDNVSFSTRTTLRGLHYQLGRPQGKLIMVVYGEIFDAAVDIRWGSPNFGKWVGVSLSSQDYRQLYVPPGFAHGFCVTSDIATVLYKCTDFYAPKEERGIVWNDPLLAIEWPFADPILSEKDKSYLNLNNISREDLPTFGSSR